MTKKSDEINRNKGLGLNLIPNEIRLPLVIALILCSQFLPALPYVLMAFTVGFLLNVLNLQIKHRFFFYSVLFMTFFPILLGNLLFSPENCGGFQIGGLIRINPCGFDTGLFHAIKRTSQVLIGLAWINSTNYHEVSETFWYYIKTFSKRIELRRYTTVTFFLMSKLNYEFDLIGKCLKIHQKNIYPRLKRKIVLWVYLGYLRLSAVVIRMFSNIVRITFAGEAHYSESPEIDTYEINFQKYKAWYSSLNSIALNIDQLTINEGDFIYLFGESNSGKTTFLRAIAQYIPKIQGNCEGSISIGKDQELTRNSSLDFILKNIKYISHDPFEFIIGITVGQEIMGHTQDRNLAEKYLDDMGLNEFWERNVFTLSGGEQMRLILSCLLASKAKIILMDYPLGQLDIKGRISFIASFKKYLEKTNATVVICDPFYELFSKYVTRTILLDEGKIIEDNKYSRGEAPANLNNIKAFHLSGKTNGFEKTTKDSSDLICEAKNINISIANKLIVQNFNFRIYESELVALTGPNGIGKTTAMLGLSGAIQIDSGDLYLSGPIGYSFQNPDLQIIETEVSKEIQLSPKIINWDSKKINMFAKAELNWLNLNANDETLFMQRSDSRLLSVSSMIAGISLLIIDEPTNQLVGEKLTKFMEKLKELLDTGIGVIIITHDPNLIRLATRTVEMT